MANPMRGRIEQSLIAVEVVEVLEGHTVFPAVANNSFSLTPFIVSAP